MSVQLLSVNVGRLQLIPGAKKSSPTGIFKLPVSGPVHVGPAGLEGDHIGSTRYHGGPDQAVYLYSAEDYAWWEGELQRKLPFGTFGENLTISHWGGARPRVGDRWTVGEVELELSAPRVPCSTLAARMEEPTFVKRFAAANRGGAYARVLRAGALERGCSVVIDPAPQPWPAIDDVFAAWHQRKKDPQVLSGVLKSPLASRLRQDIEGWLARHV